MEYGHSARHHQQLTLDVAYVGVHGYNEAHSVDLNEPALGTGWDTQLFNSDDFCG